MLLLRTSIKKDIRIVLVATALALSVLLFAYRWSRPPYTEATIDSMVKEVVPAGSSRAQVTAFKRRLHESDSLIMSSEDPSGRGFIAISFPTRVSFKYFDRHFLYSEVRFYFDKDGKDGKLIRYEIR